METKSPEFGVSPEAPKEDAKTSKTDAKPTKADKPAPKIFEDSTRRPSLFEDKKPTKPQSLFESFEQTAVKKPPLEALATDEQVLVVEEHAAANLNAANAELIDAEPQTPAEAAAIAGATFNEAVKERIDNGELPTGDMLDGAMNDTAEILGLEPDDIEAEAAVVDDAIGEPASPDFAAPGMPGVEQVTAEEADPGETLPAELDPSARRTAPETEDAEPVEPSEQPQQPVTPLVSPSVPNPAAANANANQAPPLGFGGPGGPPFGPAGPGGGGGGGGGFGPGGFNMNIGPGVVAAANLAPWANPQLAAGLVANRATSHNRHSHLPYLLAGGVLGYLIGRRRGRIKTEKKLMPVQKKLEQQVGDLQYQLAAREARIRKLAYEQAIAQPHIFAELPKRLKELQELQKASLKKEHFAHEELSKKSKKPALAKEAAAVAISAELLSKVTEITERHDHSSEARTSPDVQTTQPDTARSERPKLVADMTLQELLQVAEQIPIEGRDLRRLYESGRIGDIGLRRIITAYLRGEHYDKLLRENLTPDTTHETLPPLDDSNNQSGDADVVNMQDGGLPSSDLLQDRQFISVRQEYYQELTAEDSELHESHTGRTIIVVTIGVAVAATLLIVFG